MRDTLSVIAALVAICAGLAFVVWLTVYKWNDCRKVGHTQLYCLMDLK
jgi:hypothetical protein